MRGQEQTIIEKPTTPAGGRPRRRLPGVKQIGNKWWIDTRYRGHRIREGYLTKEAAEFNLQKARTLIDENRYGEVKHRIDITLAEFSKEYLEWCRKIGQRGIRHKASHFRSLLEYFGSDTYLHRINKKQVECYQAERLSKPGSRGFCPKGHIVNREVATLRHMFSKAVEWGKSAANPCKGVKKLEEPRSES